MNTEETTPTQPEESPAPAAQHDAPSAPEEQPAASATPVTMGETPQPPARPEPIHAAPVTMGETPKPPARPEPVHAAPEPAHAAPDPEPPARQVKPRAEDYEEEPGDNIGNRLPGARPPDDIGNRRRGGPGAEASSLSTTGPRSATRVAGRRPRRTAPARPRGQGSAGRGRPVPAAPWPSLVASAAPAAPETPAEGHSVTMGGCSAPRGQPLAPQVRPPKGGAARRGRPEGEGRRGRGARTAEGAAPGEAGAALAEGAHLRRWSARRRRRLP